MRGILEDDVGAVELDQAAQQEEAGVVGDARGLLHVVGDDHHGALVFEAEHQLFDLGGGDGVERRAGLVEQQHLGIDRQRARDAQPLLLAAGERVGRFVQLVLDLVPQRGAPQALLHLFGAFRRGWPCR